MLEHHINELMNNPDFQVLKRIPMMRDVAASTTSEPIFIATIIDLETMGINAQLHEIIEIGLLSFAFSNKEGILDIRHQYNELQDPGKPIPEEITKITGITDNDVKGRQIDWPFVLKALNDSHLVLCHNAQFDRNFLELRTPVDIQIKIKYLPFGCTLKDINWKNRHFESAKLDYLNWKLGYFYDGHRAINDCWATLNLLLHEPGSFDELKTRVRIKQTLICANNAPFEKKDLLKNRLYRWSDGSGTLPKCWWTIIDNELLASEKHWLDTEIYEQEHKSDLLPKKEITAKMRYSFRVELLD